MKTFTYFSLILFVMTSMLACQKTIENVPGVSWELAKYRKDVLSDITYVLTFHIPMEQEAPIPANMVATFHLSKNSIDLPMDFRMAGENISFLSINGSETAITVEHEHLLLPQELLQKGENTVTIHFTAGESSLNRNPEYLYTLFVPDRARTAFPLFDQPNLKAKYQLTLQLPSHWNAISNAPLASKTEADATTTWMFEPSDVISSYLFSFVAGKFERITRTVNGREMTMLHRETDQEKVARNIDEIFQLHAFSLDWLEKYTGIDYPFEKFDFALIPSFQYGGMEHVGAIQYRASGLFLDESPSQSQLLSRASLIAHETAHMWFGDLVTMQWFNDVWTKEVFANFMAAKMMNPRFPEINHDLNFLVRHYPGAYSVDRTEGANPIRQKLPNLNEAGTMYGAIIYNKAPIMMRQLELLVGKEAFREGLQTYLTTYSFANATWPDLIDILDRKSESDLKKWSEVWVNTKGRPEFQLHTQDSNLEITQVDPSHQGSIWPQSFDLTGAWDDTFVNHSILSDKTTISVPLQHTFQAIYPNSNGFGYGLFPQRLKALNKWNDLEEVTKGSALINLYEGMLEGHVDPTVYFEKLSALVPDEKNQLLLNLELGHLRTIYWNFFEASQRTEAAPELEATLWKAMMAQTEASRRKIFFNAWESVVLTSGGLDRLYHIWDKSDTVNNLPLSENDFISMAGTLVIKDPSLSDSVVTSQLKRITNPDRKRRFEFITPSLSADQSVRDDFFESLKDEKNRQTESWVLEALAYLHHPLRTAQSEKYLLPSLELLEEIQTTGDIFFPGRWMDATLGNYNSDAAVKTVRTFLTEHPDYNYQLKLKILQSADMMFRVNDLKDND